jgi:hypothetical protein
VSKFKHSPVQLAGARHDRGQDLERDALSRTRSNHIFPIDFMGLAGVKVTGVKLRAKTERT